MEYLSDKQQKKYYEIDLNLLEFLAVATNFMIKKDLTDYKEIKKEDLQPIADNQKKGSGCCIFTIKKKGKAALEVLQLVEGEEARPGRLKDYKQRIEESSNYKYRLVYFNNRIYLNEINYNNKNENVYMHKPFIKDSINKLAGDQVE